MTRTPKLILWAFSPPYAILLFAAITTHFSDDVSLIRYTMWAAISFSLIVLGAWIEAGQYSDKLFRDLVEEQERNFRNRNSQ